MSCGTDNSDTMVGADFIIDRDWSTPVDTVFFPVRSDTWFEAIVQGGRQEDLLIGRNRKFFFTAAVRWDDFPAVPDSFVSAGIRIEPVLFEGSSEIRIERISEDWTEGVPADSAFAVLTGGYTTPLTPGGLIPIDIDWVRTWADSAGSNRGLQISMVDDDGSFLRVAAHEDTDSTARPIVLELVYNDSATVDTARIDPVADRFDGTKSKESDYAADNEPSDTLLVGMRESLTNQAMFQLSLPEKIRTATVNRAKLILSLSGARLDEGDFIDFEVHTVLNDSITTDSIAIDAVIAASGAYAAAESSAVITLDMTSFVASWVADKVFAPRILLRATQNSGWRRYVSIVSADAPTDSLRPRLDVLFTPPRPGFEGEKR